jgi:hypothetical protein
MEAITVSCYARPWVAFPAVGTKKTLQVWIQLQDNKQWLSLGGQTNNAHNV